MINFTTKALTHLRRATGSVGYAFVAVSFVLGSVMTAQGAIDPTNRSNTGVCADDRRALSISQRIILNQDMDGTQLASCRNASDGTNNYNIPEEDEDDAADREFDFDDRDGGFGDGGGDSGGFDPGDGGGDSGGSDGGFDPGDGGGSDGGGTVDGPGGEIDPGGGEIDPGGGTVDGPGGEIEP